MVGKVIIRKDNAERNIKRLIKDIGIKGVSYKRDSSLETPDYVGEHIGYILKKGNVTVEILMPAYAMKYMRYKGLKPQSHPEYQSAWDFARITINGSRWLWCYVVEQLQEEYK